MCLNSSIQTCARKRSRKLLKPLRLELFNYRKPLKTKNKPGRDVEQLAILTTTAETVITISAIAKPLEIMRLWDRFRPDIIIVTLHLRQTSNNQPTNRPKRALIKRYDTPTQKCHIANVSLPR